MGYGGLKEEEAGGIHVMAIEGLYSLVCFVINYTH